VCCVCVELKSRCKGEKRGLRMSENKVLWRMFVSPPKKCLSELDKEGNRVSGNSGLKFFCFSHTLL
jgi:hypothetical protein